MAQKTINVGSSVNSGGGDALRNAMIKINDNFTELYTKVGGLEDGQIVTDVQGSVFADDSTLLVDAINGTIPAANLAGALPAIDGSALTGISSGGGLADLVDDTTPQLGGNLDLNNFDITGTGDIPAANLTGTLPALDGSALTGVTASSIAFADVTATPTTLTGYGIADAYTQTQVDTAITNATSSIVIPVGSTQSIDVVAADSTLLVDSVNGTLNATTLTGALPAIDGSSLTGVTTAFSNITSTPTTIAGYGITDAFDGAFGSLSGTPTTIAGYGITDAFDGAFGSLSGTPTTLAGYGITDAFDGAFGSLSGTPTTLAGYGITDAANTGSATTFTANVLFDTGVQEKFATLTGSTGVTVMDCDNGQVFYLTGAAGDITANFTNLGLTAEYGTNLTVIINQGATPYEVTAVQIGGVAQTIEWQGGVAPTGNANGIDSFSFTILNDGGSYVVLGQMVDFT